MRNLIKEILYIKKQSCQPPNPLNPFVSPNLTKPKTCVKLRQEETKDTSAPSAQALEEITMSGNNPLSKEALKAERKRRAYQKNLDMTGKEMGALKSNNTKYDDGSHRGVVESVTKLWRRVRPKGRPPVGLNPAHSMVMRKNAYGVLTTKKKREFPVWLAILATFVAASIITGVVVWLILK